MADVSNVSGSGAVPPNQNVQNQPAAPADQALPTNAADFNEQQDTAFDFLQQELTQGLAAQKADLR